MTNSPPSSSAPSVDNPCAYLPQLRAALYQLMIGAKSSEVRDGDRWMKFHQGNVVQLRAEIRKLETICGADGQVSNAPRAVRAGPLRSSAHRFHNH
jgi:hypothetical protein